MHEGNILNDPIVWYTLALFLFFVGIYAAARKPVVSMLDAEIAKVRSELDEARKLRLEAEASLAEYDERKKSALLEAEAILAQATADADVMRKQAEDELRASIKTREAQALIRIEQAEHAVLQEVRTVVVNQAMEAAREALAAKIDGAAGDRLVETAISSAPSLVEPSKVA